MTTKDQTAQSYRPLETRCLPGFLPALGGRLDALEHDPLPAYGLTDEIALAYVNPAWDVSATLAKTPEPWPLGRPIRTALGPLERAFVDTLERAAECGSASLPYECPIPTQRRRFVAKVQHLGASGYIVRNQLLLAEPAGRDTDLHVAAYRNAEGMIRQCANCRRTNRPDSPDSWDWVPELVEPGVEQVTHGLCQFCLKELYPELL